MNEKMLSLLGFYEVCENEYQLDFENEGVSFTYYLDVQVMAHFINGDYINESHNLEYNIRLLLKYIR